MRLLPCLCVLLPLSLAACGPEVTLEGDSAGGIAGAAGGSGGAAPLDSIEAECSTACSAIVPPCNTDVDCTVVCAKLTAVAATSDTCATATAAAIACLPQMTEANECTGTCSPAAEPFVGCFESWCEQNPDPCAAGTSP